MNNIVLLFIEMIVVFGSLTFVSWKFKKAGLIGWVGVATILANLITAKNVDIFGMNVAIGTVLFASTFLATDMLTEMYSKEDARQAVYFGLFCATFFIAATQIALMYVPSSIDYAHPFMEGLFGLNLRISIASIVMYFVANMADVYLFSKIKEKTGGKYLWLRNNVSTILCNCLENFGFIGLAFWGIYDVQTIVIIALSTSIIETIAGVCDTPFLYLAKYINDNPTKLKLKEKGEENAC